MCGIMVYFAYVFAKTCNTHTQADRCVCARVCLFVWANAIFGNNDKI